MPICDYNYGYATINHFKKHDNNLSHPILPYVGQPNRLV